MIYRFLVEYLPTLDNAVVFEIGAHIGTDTWRMRRMLKEPCTYYAFEPDPLSAGVLSTVGGVHIVTKAVADVDGSVPFYKSRGRSPNGALHTASSSIKRPKMNVVKRPWLRFERDEVVAVRLDTFCAERGVNHIDFIWMDVQAAELDVIRGGQVALASTAYLYTECIEYAENYEGQPSLAQIMAALPGRWQVVEQTKTDVLLRNTDYIH